ncbi:hypothetical protein [Rubrivivax gelatinosus]|uniref:ElaB/YqjD/DUF883 family membrane-anchored ribosome-binding protein n=2 Tax=Rubrivivax gelatinosus TaxID=28068 RepID=A0ABS1DXY5_RUBGE|nr:hypothetical protein [Rubrivivax gelatinosus]MBK1714954.1 hypothetical protein [Rubrivivax gelatinosus]
MSTTPPEHSPATTDAPAPAPNPADELLQRVVQGAHDGIDRIAEQAAPRLRQLHDGAQDAGERVQAKADELRGLGENWTDGLRDTVRQHPIAAVATALAVGVLIARLTR